jgi:hypothetical protein
MIADFKEDLLQLSITIAEVLRKDKWQCNNFLETDPFLF